MANKKFLRRNTDRYKRLGSNRKKLQKWRKQKGRHGKMRQKQRGYSRTVEIGYRQDKETRGKINDMNVILISNLKELEAVKTNSLLTLGKVGKKKKIEIAKRAIEKKLEFVNFNAKKLIKQTEKENKKEKPEEKGKKKAKEEKK
jgi:ribosomal protein L32E